MFSSFQSCDNFLKMNVKIEPTWKTALADEFAKDYFKNLVDFVKSEYGSKTIYPAGKEIFRAFDLCPFDETKVVIIGQDPYHGPGQANGLCFAVKSGMRLPPSLQNIYKEMHSDLGQEMPTDGDLSYLAEQGVLMLNATLTVRARQAGSHQNKGWEAFTDSAIAKLNEEKENLVFILWGKYAQQKGKVIDRKKHLVIESAHPSPFSVHRGFFGSKPFSKTNAYLEQHNKQPIEWIKNS
jgi:uracil-DNA glycosylase